MDNQIINCRCGRERRNKESNWSGLMCNIITRSTSSVDCVKFSEFAFFDC